MAEMAASNFAFNSGTRKSSAACMSVRNCSVPVRLSDGGSVHARHHQALGLELVEHGMKVMRVKREDSSRMPRGACAGPCSDENCGAPMKPLMPPSKASGMKRPRKKRAGGRSY